jgi:hypothetical protein
VIKHSQFHAPKADRHSRLIDFSVDLLAMACQSQRDHQEYFTRGVCASLVKQRILKKFYATFFLSQISSRVCFFANLFL